MKKHKTIIPILIILLGQNLQCGTVVGHNEQLDQLTAKLLESEERRRALERNNEALHRENEELHKELAQMKGKLQKEANSNIGRLTTELIY